MTRQEDDAIVARSLLAGHPAHALVDLTTTAHELGFAHEVFVTPEAFSLVDHMAQAPAGSGPQALVRALHTEAMTVRLDESFLFAVSTADGPVSFRAHRLGPEGPWLVSVAR